MTNTDLIIIGGGAAGLMAGAAAGEAGLRAVILERCPKPGRKLLMCGNNRCNITTSKPTREFLTDYGDPLTMFLEPAISAFPPGALRDWFHKNGLVTKMQRDKRVYPQSERAIDVHHCFTDQLAKHGIGMMLNSPVQEIRQGDHGLTVITANLELTAKNILIATGGVSWPKTGSVGDGQKMAASLGHKVLPYRPGLAGFNLSSHKLRPADDVELTILSGGKPVATTHGALEVEKYGISGPAVINACRIISRQNLKDISFDIQIGPKHWKVTPEKPRPLKEAMTTVGGVALNQINPQTMESKKVPGLYFAGEVLDIDGPCGGYNLQAAFSTARLAINSIAKTAPVRKNPPQQKRRKSRGQRYHQNRKRS
jgi:predicted Rossmann fold flavoprotein